MPKRRIPSLNWLRVFEAAARTQSFARAAEQLGMSNAAVSQQIKALETHFRKQLFTRGAHSIALTDVGRAFLPVVRQSLGALEVSAAGLFGNPYREVLSVRVLQVFADGWLAKRLLDFQQQYPHIHIQVATCNGPSPQHGREYDLDIVFAAGPQYGEEGDLLFHETLFPVALPAISDQIETLADLFKFRLINLSEHYSGWLQIFSQETEVQQLSEAEFIYTDNTSTALHFAAAGLGVALARMPGCDGLHQKLGLTPCLTDYAITGNQSYYLVYPSRSGLGNAAGLFREWLLGCCSSTVFFVGR